MVGRRTHRLPRSCTREEGCNESLGAQGLLGLSLGLSMNNLRPITTYCSYMHTRATTLTIPSPFLSIPSSCTGRSIQTGKQASSRGSTQACSPEGPPSNSALCIHALGRPDSTTPRHHTRPTRMRKPATFHLPTPKGAGIDVQRVYYVPWNDASGKSTGRLPHHSSVPSCLLPSLHSNHTTPHHHNHPRTPSTHHPHREHQG